MQGAMNFRCHSTPPRVKNQFRVLRPFSPVVKFCTGRRIIAPEWVVFGLLLICGGGCMLGPNFRQPAAPVADKWLEADNPAVDSNRQEFRDWWTVFSDPVLTRLIQLAYQRNLTLQTAGVRVLEARAQLGIAIGEF